MTSMDEKRHTTVNIPEDKIDCLSAELACADATTAGEDVDEEEGVVEEEALAVVVIKVEELLLAEEEP